MEQKKTTLEQAETALKAVLENAEVIGQFGKDNDTALLVIGTLDKGERSAIAVGYAGTTKNTVISIVKAMHNSKEVRETILLAARVYSVSDPILDLAEPCDCPECSAKKANN